MNLNEREVRTTLRIAYLLLFLFFFSYCTQVRQADPEEEVIKSIREFSNQSIAKRDTTAILTTLAVDFHAVTSRNADIDGSNGMIKRFASEFKAKPDVSYVRTPQQVRIFQKWNSASERGSWKATWTDPDGPIEVTGVYYAKWMRVKGKWLIRAEIFVPRQCEGGAYCEQGSI